jgi:hypothetical protein
MAKKEIAAGMMALAAGAAVSADIKDYPSAVCVVDPATAHATVMMKNVAENKFLPVVEATQLSASGKPFKKNEVGSFSGTVMVGTPDGKATPDFGAKFNANVTAWNDKGGAFGDCTYKIPGKRAETVPIVPSLPKFEPTKK